ncbi:MAG: hypothetical protein HZC28_14020 [Spirochaetes bacterium]|nr:hypothetical protein [Spirochaetota bacterium]
MKVFIIILLGIAPVFAQPLRGIFSRNFDTASYYIGDMTLLTSLGTYENRYEWVVIGSGGTIMKYATYRQWCELRENENHRVINAPSHLDGTFSFHMNPSLNSILISGSDASIDVRYISASGNYYYTVTLFSPHTHWNSTSGYYSPDQTYNPAGISFSVSWFDETARDFITITISSVASESRVTFEKRITDRLALNISIATYSSVSLRYYL